MVPRVYFYDTVYTIQVLVTDFFEGIVYAEFEEMDSHVKLACIRCVKQLHDSYILHGDLRAPNFVVQQESRNPSRVKVFAIDFGRSMILPKELGSEKKLKREWDEFLYELHCNEYKEMSADEIQQLHGDLQANQGDGNVH